MRAAQGPRRAVNQSGRAVFPKAGEPLVSRADTDARRLGSFFDPKSVIDHSSDKKRSTARCKPGMFMHVHLGPLDVDLVCTSSIPGSPRINNLPRDHN